MSAREFFNNNPAVVTGAAVLVLVLCLTAISCSLFGWGKGGGGSAKVKLIYFDLSNDTIKLVPAADRAGSPLADSPDAYLCYIMSCGECKPKAIKDGATIADIEAAGMFVAYLQTLPSADDMMSRELMMEGNVEIYDMMSDQWFNMNSQEGMNVAHESRACDDGSTAKACQP